MLRALFYNNFQTFYLTLKHLFYIVSLFLVSSVLRGQTSLDTAVNFTVKDVNGITHYLNEYLQQDKIVVIDFFTITCGPCSAYAPLINESYTHFGCNTSNVIFLGINWGADNAGVSDFGNTYGVHYPEISGTEGNGNHVVADYAILSYPTVVLILPNSYIAEKYIWPPSTEHLDSTILVHGGILSDCNTPISDFREKQGDKNSFLKIFPVPAGDMISCLGTYTEPGYIEAFSANGSMVISKLPISPGRRLQIGTSELAPGYYFLLLRNNHGTVIDLQPFIIQKQY